MLLNCFNSRGGFPNSFNFPCDQANDLQLHTAMTTNPVFSRSIFVKQE